MESDRRIVWVRKEHAHLSWEEVLAKAQAANVFDIRGLVVRQTSYRHFSITFDIQATYVSEFDGSVQPLQTGDST